jgi:O-antigen/teichoic acid export membrane protein
VWWFSTHNATLSQILLAVIAGSFVNAIIIFFRAGKIVPISLRADVEYWRYIFKETWPIAISIVLNLLYFRLDTIFLSVFRSLQEVGLYGAAYKILEILVTFPSMFIGLVMPVLSATAFVDPERFRSVFQKAFRALLLGALPLLVGGLILARPLIVFVGGDAYAGATSFFQILMFAVLFLFFGALSGHTITAIHEQRKMVWAYLSVAAGGILLYLLLIPPFGAYGAAIGTVVTEGSIMIAGFAMIYRKMRVRPSLSGVGSLLLSVCVMGIAVYFARSLHVLIAAAIGMLVYACMIFITKAIDRSLIKQIVGSENQETNTL